MSEPRAKRDRLKRLVGALESAGWTVMDRLPNCVEFWKHHPGGPPSPRVLVYVDGTMRGDRNDVAEARDDIKRIRANAAGQGRRKPYPEPACSQGGCR